MPLKDLLRMYGYGDPSMENSNSSDQMLTGGGNEAEGEGHTASDKAGNEADDDMDDEEDEEDEEDDEDDEDEDPNAAPDLKKFYTDMVKGKKLNNNENSRCGVDKNGENDGDAKKDSSTCEGDTTAGANPCGSKNGENSVGIDGKDSRSKEGNCHEGENSEGVGSCVVGADSTSGGGSGGGGSSRLLRSVSRPQSEEEEDDCDYSPDEEEWKKTIMVGSRALGTCKKSAVIRYKYYSLSYSQSKLFVKLVNYHVEVGILFQTAYDCLGRYSNFYCNNRTFS